MRAWEKIKDNRHVQNICRLLLYLAVSCAAMTAWEAGRRLLGIRFLSESIAPESLERFLVGGALWSCAAVAAVNLFFWVRVEHWEISRVFRPIRFLKCSLIGSVTGIFWVGMIFALLLVLTLFHIVDVEPVFQTSLRGSSLIPALLWMFGNAAGEELLFRGYPYQSCKREYSTGVAMAAAVTIPMVFAVFDGTEGLLPFINTFLAAAVFTLIRRNWDSLWAAIVAHFIWNVFQNFVRLKGEGSTLLLGNSYFFNQLEYSGSGNGLVAAVAGVLLLAVLASWYLWRKSLLQEKTKE